MANRVRGRLGGVAICMLAGLWLTATRPALAQEGGIDPRICAEAAQIVSALAPRIAEKYPTVLSLQSPGPLPSSAIPPEDAGTLTEASSFWLFAWDGGHAPTELIRAWLHTPDTSVSRCWTKGQVGAPLPILTAEDEARLLGQPQTRDKTIVYVGLPVFDAGHTRALVYLATVCPGLCGIRAFFTLEKIDGVWQPAGSKIVAIS